MIHYDGEPLSRVFSGSFFVWGGIMEEFSPFDYQPLVGLRALAVLPAAGAWDDPVEHDCPYAEDATLFVAYTEGAQGGAVDLRIEVSPYAADIVTASWYNAALYEPANVVAGADAVSLIQREYVTYTATGALEETFVYQVHVAGDIQRIRVSARESGAVANPGTCSIVGIIK